MSRSISSWTLALMFTSLLEPRWRNSLCMRVNERKKGARKIEKVEREKDREGGKREREKEREIEKGREKDRERG